MSTSLGKGGQEIAIGYEENEFYWGIGLVGD